MLRKLIFVFALLLPVILFSQDKKAKRLPRSKTGTDTLQSPGAGRSSRTDSGAGAAQDTVATIDMYKIVTLQKDTTIVDTSLTIQHEYRVNYLRKDLFGLLQFPNEGQTYNKLDFGRTEFNPFPQFGFRAKHFAYLEVDDINYYHVATPFTDLFYRSVLEQGQMLDAFITLNTSENLNLAVGYKGIRSLGKYINSLSSNGVLRLIASYHTTDRRYQLNVHFTGQDFTNQENGGVVDLSQFESSEEPYNQRERIEVYFNDASSILKGNRYFIDHTFRLNKDNPNSIVLHHQFNYENKFFEFVQPTLSERFGPAFTSRIHNKTRYNRMYNVLGAAYANENLGSLEFYVEDFNYNYFYRTIILNDQGGVAIPNRINDRINTYGAKYSYKKGQWDGSILVSNSITDQSLANIDVAARYAFDEENSVSARYQNMNKLPDLNYRLYQSDYVAYNWFNEFKNEKINNIEFEARTKWLTASVQYVVLKDHLYFREAPEPALPDALIVLPGQYAGTINYFSVKAGREFRYWKFGLDNTLLYQKVDQQDDILNVPEFITRNTLYFSDHFFKKALYIQTGITFQYFTEYYMNDYNPLLGEFYIQDKRKVGGFPLMDFFINAKIRNFRVFLKAEHFNSGFTGYNYYSAPGYPYRDFTIRLGVVWDFFS